VKRSTPLSHKTPLRRETPMKKKRSGTRRTAVFRDPKYRAWLRKQLCSVQIACQDKWFWYSAAGPVEAAHGPSAGTRVKGPDNEAIPLCQLHHRLQHQIGWPEFEKQAGISRKAIAREHWERYQREKGK
jgi:hypothetical protein